MRPEDSAAAPLIEELSDALAKITGSSGKNSFSNADMEDARSIFLVAKAGDLAIACGALRRIDDRTCELKRMYAKEKRRGLGSLMLARLEQEAGRLGYERIRLETRRVNQGAVKFYLKHGYAVVPNFGKYVGNAAAVCFEKRVEADLPRSRLEITTTSELMPRVERVLDGVHNQLRRLLPQAEIEHIGATAIPNGLTKGDVDVMVRVAPREFQAATDVLAAHFEIKQRQNWTPHFASFGDDRGYDLPLGIQLVARDSEDDIFGFLRDFLVASPVALAEYNRLKTEHAPKGRDAYWEAKNAFFAKILAGRRE